MAEPRRRSFTEQARRAQLVEVTTALVAEHGYAGTSLSRIAAAAGISKAAVLYHFASKEAVVRAAHEQALADLVAEVGAAVDQADPADAPLAYVQTMVAHLSARPAQTHVIIEEMAQRGERPQPEGRWRPLAELLQAARRARGRPELPDARTAALAVGGAVNAVVAERLADPGYDTASATTTVTGMVEQLLDG
ncbi:TetR/AcrR family transcriptional regulator [Desertihabitans aurantiacus]|uniref:TetR/AcrR family transcriptional regulator n=1 Tax=Desertihabitans aurantiacus TaxID=2282477 RepID=UPI000DF7F035|nr:TetR/AcrR family transcriptional regulator [Desertihabitans aurantiacus]